MSEARHSHWRDSALLAQHADGFPLWAAWPTRLRHSVRSFRSVLGLSG